MARYDRIARLDPPERGGAFNGWLTLRDLEGREREPELGRRARLRYLALRPVRRLLTRGLEALDEGSFQRQLESVREELGQLPTRDPERQLLSDYLKQVGGRAPDGMGRATLDVGASAELAGHTYAAEEFYRTGLELADAYGLAWLRVEALHSLGRVYRRRGRWDRAVEYLGQAAALADAGGDLVEWARAMDGIAGARLHAGERDGARSALDEVARRGHEARERHVVAIAAAGRCALEVATGNPEAALRAGWEAVELLSPGDELRNRVLLNMASSFRRLGLRDAATSCYHIVEQWAPWPEHRVEAKVESAVLAAEAGDTDAFVSRRNALTSTLDRSDGALSALVDLGLGRGSLLLDRVEDAREHLRAAIATARDIDATDVLTRAEALLDTLERRAAIEIESQAVPSDGTRQIAERVASLELAPAI